MADSGGTLGGELPDPTRGLDAVPAGPTAPARPQNPIVDAVAGPAAALEVDLATVKKVIRGYEAEIQKLLTARREVNLVSRVQNPGEDDSSYSYRSEHDGTAASLQEAWQSLIETLTARRNNLDAVVRQYEGTESANAGDLKEQ